jgi:cytochrome c oxidase subunit 2
MRSRSRRALLSVAGAVCLVWLLAAPVAAQSTNRELIDGLNTQLLYVALPLTVFVELILVYAVIRFRDNDDPKPTADSPALEITWTLATAIILLFVGVSAYVVLTSPFISPGAGAPTETLETDERVEALGYQWGWEFTYPEADVSTQGVLVLPADRNASIELTSADVLHSLFIPDLGVKRDVFPAKETTIRTRPTETGDYRAYCTELCGAGHSRMRADVVVVSNATYQDWLDDHAGEESVTEAPTPE